MEVEKSKEKPISEKVEETLVIINKKVIPQLEKLLNSTKNVLECIVNELYKYKEESKRRK